MADISFEAKMTNFIPNAPLKDGAVTKFTIVVKEDSSNRTFPNQFKTPKLSVFESNAVNDLFDKINVPLRDYVVDYDMTFGGIAFRAKIDNLSAAIKRRKDGTAFTIYTLKLVKEVEKDIDWKLSCYVKLKEENDDGKKVDKFFAVNMTEVNE